jgi:hypothetical protein
MPRPKARRRNRPWSALTTDSEIRPAGSPGVCSCGRTERHFSPSRHNHIYRPCPHSRGGETHVVACRVEREALGRRESLHDRACPRALSRFGNNFALRKMAIRAEENACSSRRTISSSSCQTGNKGVEPIPNCRLSSATINVSAILEILDLLRLRGWPSEVPAVPIIETTQEPTGERPAHFSVAIVRCVDSLPELRETLPSLRRAARPRNSRRSRPFICQIRMTTGGCVSDSKTFTTAATSLWYGNRPNVFLSMRVTLCSKSLCNAVAATDRPSGVRLCRLGTKVAILQIVRRRDGKARMAVVPPIRGCGGRGRLRGDCDAARFAAFSAPDGGLAGFLRPIAYNSGGQKGPDPTASGCKRRRIEPFSTRMRKRS